MKKYIQSGWMRVLSTILCAIFIVSLGVGILAFLVQTEYGDTEAFKEEGYKTIAQHYGLYATDMVLQGKVEQLEKEFVEKNINCSIRFVTNNPGENNEVVSTIEQEFLIGNFGDEEKIELEIVPGAEIEYCVNSLPGVMMGCIEYSELDDWAEYPIYGFVYSIDRGLFYYKTMVGYAPVEYVYVPEGELYYDYKLVHKDGKWCYYNDYYNKTLDTSGYQEWTQIRIDEYNLTPTIVEDYHSWQENWESDFIYVANGMPKEEEIWTDAYQIAGNQIYCPTPEYTDVYQVEVSCTKPTGDSLFVQCDELCKVLAVFEGSWGYMIIFSILAIIVMLVLLIYTAKNQKEQMNYMERLPVFLYSGVVFLLGCFLVVMFVELVEWLIIMDSGSIQEVLALGLLVCVITVWLAVNWFQNVVTRIKCKSFWRTSELYYLYKLIKRSWGFVTGPFKAVVNVSKNALRMMGDNIPLFWGGLVVFIVLSFIELILGVQAYWETDMYILLYFIFKIVEVVALVAVLYYMQQLHEGSKRVAYGDMSHPIDTSKMLWKFREHGENINKVSDGIAAAVKERMKSEHFKTELITNVSHDIKTPLTSIINYVDLIKKEDIQDEKVQEYIDVLDRQSARLKKLIEDLMEASKASTGNLTVNWEECDLDVLLTQLIGEFEERLAKNQLEVIVNKPDNPVKLMTDGKHIWRVLDNLLNNACKYSLPNTRVYVTLSQEGGYIKITFKNISKEALNIPSEELMERFVRGDSSRNTEGSGLGLSIAQSLTELMKGNMKLEIDGDLFKVTLLFPAM